VIEGGLAAPGVGADGAVLGIGHDGDSRALQPGVLQCPCDLSVVIGVSLQNLELYPIVADGLEPIKQVEVLLSDKWRPEQHVEADLHDGLPTRSSA